MICFVLFLQDIFTMTNRLHLTTPCECFKELISNYDFQVSLGEHYGMSLDFKAKTNNEWKSVSTHVFFPVVCYGDYYEISLNQSRDHNLNKRCKNIEGVLHSSVFTQLILSFSSELNNVMRFVIIN